MLGGPEFSFLTRAKEQEGGRTFDVRDAVQTVDVGVIAAIGYAAGHLGVEGRFDLGLKDLNDNLGSDLKVRSRTIRINLTWRP